MNKLENDLMKLGATNNDIANTLCNKQIKGTKKSSCHCPIAKYLLSLGYEDPYVHGEIYATKGDCRVRVRFTNAISIFVSDFDKGKYPELEESAIGS